MGLFSQEQIEQITSIAKQSQTVVESKKSQSSRGMTAKLAEISKVVQEYFKDSNARLITTASELEQYVSRVIEYGYCAVDTETTGLDRIHDTIVGFSMYYPGEPEVYIPCNHRVPIFDEPYPNQLSYDTVHDILLPIPESSTKIIFANADFDLSMIFKDFNIDFLPNFYYDVILAWRCIKEDERDNALKSLYNKYVLKGAGSPMKFRDFFPPDLFPYCKPEVAKLYAANDAKITFDLFKWQLPYLLKENKRCIDRNLGAIADLVWGVEFPLVHVCQKMHRQGIYLEQSVADRLRIKYANEMAKEEAKLRQIIQELMVDPRYHAKTKPPFKTVDAFNYDSPIDVKWLCYDLLGLESSKTGGTGKEILGTFNLPVTNQILKCRSLGTLISTFVEKLPNAVAPDGKIHCQFKQIGADTGRFSSASPKAYWAVA